MARRVIVTMTVADELTANDVAVWVDGLRDQQVPPDATVWEWGDFWADVDEGVVGPTIDTTTERGEWA